MPRYKLTIEYDGTGYWGWQRQKDKPSIQQALEEAIHNFCGEAAEVFVAGRTDAGVHAFGQVAHVDISKKFNPYNVMQGINFHLLPARIVVVEAEEISDEFHARFSATKRHYLYRISNRQARLAINIHRAWHVIAPLNATAMHEAAQLLLGHHDFTSFRSSICQAKSPMKTLDRLDVERRGEEIHLHVSARSFLHHQVRNMAGSLMLVGSGKWTKEDLRVALEVKDRTKAGATAPAEGLYLIKVDY